jgi:hypothetical protein
MSLQALRVVVVLLLACGARLALRGALEAVATALVVLLCGDGCITSGSGLFGGDEGSRGSGRGCSGRSSSCRRSGSSGDRSSGLARRWGRRSTSTGGVEDSRARNGVLGLATIDIEQHTGIITLVHGAKVDTLRKSGGAGRRDSDLAAAVVELRTACAVALVKCDDLGAEKVVACGEVGEGDVDDALVGVELVDGPFGTSQTLLEDLDPATLALGGGGGDINQDRATVGLWYR